MRTVASTIVAASLMMTLSSQAADKVSKAELEDHIHSLNAATAKYHAENEALHGISVETGVPLERLQAIHRSSPKTSPAGLMVACVIADNTKVDPESIVRRAAEGKTWTSLASEYGVPYEKIEQRLARLETYIRSGGDQRPVERPERRD